MLFFPRWKIISITLLVLAGLVFAAPNLLSADQAARLPGWIPHQQINLGLDLQGGSHLLLEVEVEVVIAERLEAIRDDVRPLLRGERIGYTGLAATATDVRLRVRDLSEQDKAARLLRSLATPVGGGLLGGGGADIEVEKRDGGLIVLTMTDAAIDARRRAAVEQSIEIVRRRIDELGTREPTIQRQGEDRILVQLPGVDDPDRIKQLLGKTAKLQFRMIDHSVSPAQAERGRIPAGSELLPGAEGTTQTSYVVRKRVVVGGEHLVDSQPSFDQNQPVVSFRFDTQGGRRFGNITKNNVGKQLAIVLDDEVISAPVIRSAILGGSGIITGNFTVQQVNDLALLLRAGALPAPLKVLEERSVGPDLGADSVAAGKIAAIIGFTAVIVYIGLTYGLFGLAANAALIINMVLIMGVLSLLQATLTLPGIAGIVLTVGMAVDANVLIFERIREEIGVGKTPFAAVEAGYKRALGTILDANITTFIAAAILFGMGSGPVKGFAVTLAIGIITSVFTAFTLTRLFIGTWLRRTRPEELVL